MKRFAFLFAAATAFLCAQAHKFEISQERDAFIIDGRETLIRCGELHFARVPREYWRHRLRMCRALGLNAVCAYMFWNYHELERGKYDFSGEKDVAAFCRIAQEEGLWVILRPGPYTCAEWEFGGLPWWLLDEGADKVRVRTRDPKYLDAAKAFLRRVADELRDLQVTKDGPILMVQDENEYGFFGNDNAYIKELYDTLREAGFDIPVFTCNPATMLRAGAIPETFKVVNFGANPENAFNKLREVQPKGPQMCGEYYPAWFDSWGQPHHTKSVNIMLNDIDWMLSHRGSFSLYMAHGGTSFGWWAGCNSPFLPQTSSYDYEAPISEQGRATPKFHALKTLLEKYMDPAERASLPAIPEAIPVQSFNVTSRAKVIALKSSPIGGGETKDPLPMEMLGQGYGAVVYKSKIPSGKGGALKAVNLRDFACVFVDGRFAGFLDRRSPARCVDIRPVGREREVSLVVTHMSRYNFGEAMNNSAKGLMPPVTLGGEPLNGWKAEGAPMDEAYIEALDFDGAASASSGPCTFKRYRFELSRTDDTFLDVRHWSKGMVWVNGHALGRFWGIGPTQTMFVPGCWLKKGMNEFVIWDFGGNVPVEGIKCVSEPVLDELHPEDDFVEIETRFNRELILPRKPLAAGMLPNTSDAQEIMLKSPVEARQVAFFMDQSWPNDILVASIAEFELLDADGKSIPHDSWSFISVSSEEALREDGSAENAIDGQISNFWHSRWSDEKAHPPHHIAIDLGGKYKISGFRYTPRQVGVNGRVKRYRFYAADALAK